MMRISLSETGKRFNRDWIFRNFSYIFETGNSYAITGANGSGKSTLLQVICGSVVSSEGKIEYRTDGNLIEPDNAFQHISIAAPYLELIEEMTGTEFLQFHEKFKPLNKSFTIAQILERVGLQKASDKQIRYFSSGMKQRMKLAQAIFSNTSCIFLDEPCTNLDSEGIAVYQQLTAEFCASKMLIISSNDPHEYSFCTHRIDMMVYKS